MRICFVCRALDTARGGGIGAYYARFAPLVYADRHEVTVVTASLDGAERTGVRDGIRWVEVPLVDGEDWTRPHPRIASRANEAIYSSMGPSGLFAAQVAHVLPTLHAEHRFDVVEAPETGAALWLSLTRDRKAWAAEGAPRFVTQLFSPSLWIDQHNRAPAIGPWEINRRIAEREAARASDGLVCSSLHLRDWAAHHFGVAGDDVQVIPAPIDVEPAGEGEGISEISGSPPARASLGILFVGRLEPRKGIDVLIEGARRARASGIDVSLDLAGEDMTDARTGGLYGRHAAGRIGGRSASWIRFHGHVDGPRLCELRHRADVGAVPGFVDNYPLACLEMMASGLPVIVASQGGTGELVRDGTDGLVFESGDPESLALAIESIARRTAAERRALGKAGQGRVRDECDPQTVVARRLAHYESISTGRVNRAEPSPVWTAPEATRVTVEELAGVIGVECRRLPRAGEPVLAPRNEEELRELLPFLVAARATGVSTSHRGVRMRLRGVLRRMVR